MSSEDDDPGCLHVLLVFVRICLLVIALAVALWFAYLGLAVILSGHLAPPVTFQTSGRGFPATLHGLTAILVGISFLCLAACFGSIFASSPGIAPHVPSWARVPWWWFFAGWLLFYFTALYLAPA